MRGFGQLTPSNPSYYSGVDGEHKKTSNDMNGASDIHDTITELAFGLGRHELVGVAVLGLLDGAQPRSHLKETWD